VTATFQSGAIEVVRGKKEPKSRRFGGGAQLDGGPSHSVQGLGTGRASFRSRGLQGWKSAPSDPFGHRRPGESRRAINSTHGIALRKKVGL